MGHLTGFQRRVDYQRKSGAVIESFGEQQVRVAHPHKRAVRRDGVPKPNAEGLHLAGITGAHINEHVFYLHHLFALGLREEMRRLCADYPRDFDSFPGADSYSFGKKRVRPPAAQHMKPYEAIIHYGLHDEADLIHVRGNKYPGMAGTAFSLEKYVSGPVGEHTFSKFTSENPAHLALLPGCAVCLAQFSQKLNALFFHRIVHFYVSTPLASLPSLRQARGRLMHLNAYQIRSYCLKLIAGGHNKNRVMAPVGRYFCRRIKDGAPDV